MHADNRPISQFVVAFAIIALATLGVAWIAGKWAVFVPIVLIPLWRLSRGLGVRGELADQGWVGHRFKDYWVYEEQQGRDRPSLSLKLERAGDDDNHYLLLVPSEDDWRRTMPLWAVDRYREIVDRIVSDWPEEDVRWPAGHA